MRALSLVSLVMAALGLLATGCSSTLETFTCSRDVDCASDEAEGFCEDSKVCSFFDFSCPSGRRYGKLAGETSNACVESGELDASVVDARNDEDRIDAMVAIDAMPGAADAMPTAPDASPPDAMVGACGTTTLGNACVALTDCPSSTGNCCNYMITDVNTSCSDLCADIGLTCAGAAETLAACVRDKSRSCGSKDVDLICACN